MNLLQIQQKLREKVIQSADELFEVKLGQIAAETPPRPELGDLAFPIAFELAKTLKQKTGEKQNPRLIADQMKTALEEFEFVHKVEIAGPGYLNVFYNRRLFLTENLNALPLPKQFGEGSSSATKVCVEHTSVNPNKAAHIGHVRNSVLGDTFVRILRADGKHVEIQNYIDNTGVQVADVVVGFIHLLNMSLSDIVELDQKLRVDGISFDYYCWDLYARVGQEYVSNESLKEKRAEILHLIEEGGNETAELADYVATRNVSCILDTMERLSIRYDLLPRESEILHLHFWQKAFKEMKARDVIKFEPDGKNAGCWVMPFDSHTGSEEHDSDKILVRSNGTVTYTGKDIAYQMWKLGLLGLDFYYKPFHKYDGERDVWITTSGQSGGSNIPDFGKSETVYNVIDSRQSYPQEVVKKGVALIFPDIGEDASVHLSYEMVALSPPAAEELGFKLSEADRQKPFIEMSGRKGLGVKADDLIDRLEEKALSEVQIRENERLTKHADYQALSDDQRRECSHQIAVGALRYFLLKFTRNTIITFDFSDALSLEGETGVFCQYSAVRANSIFAKLDQTAIEDSEKLIRDNPLEVAAVFETEAGLDIWSLITLSNRLEETISQAIYASEPAYLAKYAFSLAKSFNLFYGKHKIIGEENAVIKALFVITVKIARDSLTAALETLGIQVPERM